MKKHNRISKRQRKWLRIVLYMALVGLLISVLVREQATFGASIDLLTTVNPLWVLLGLIVFLGSPLASSGVYLALAPKRLPFARTAVVILAGMGVNRVTPAGSGALGVSYLYLRAQKISRAVAATIVASNNLLGFVGHVLLLGLAGLLWPGVLLEFEDLSFGRLGQTLAMLAGLAVIGGIIWFWLKRKKSKHLNKIRQLLKRPNCLLAALVFSMAITLCHVSALLIALAGLDVNVSVSPAAALLIVSFGVVAASAVPVPGGIGAAEVGLYVGLKSYGITNDDALAVAILYRIITFWLPLIVGAIAFAFVGRHRMLESKS